MRESVRISDLILRCDRTWKLVLVGDALMHPGELLGGAWDYDMADRGYGDVTAIGWFSILAKHFERQAWLNPEPTNYWNGTAELIGRVFPMYELTLDGLGSAVQHLSRKGAV